MTTLRFPPPQGCVLPALSCCESCSGWRAPELAVRAFATDAQRLAPAVPTAPPATKPPPSVALPSAPPTAVPWTGRIPAPMPSFVRRAGIPGWRPPFVARAWAPSPLRPTAVWQSDGIGRVLLPVAAFALAPAGPAWAPPAWVGAGLGHAVLLGAADDLGVIEIYFSAGRRENWGLVGQKGHGLDLTGAGYRGCDDGNERNCDLWRVRWDMRRHAAVHGARLIRGKNDFGRGPDLPLALTRPAVSPDSTFLAYGVEINDTDYVYSRSGEFEVNGARLQPSVQPAYTDTQLAIPEAWGGGVNWPAFLGDLTLLTGAEFTVSKDQETPAGSGHRWDGDWTAVFKDVRATPLHLDGARWPVLQQAGAPVPLRGPRLLYDAAGVTYPTVLVSTDATRNYGVATDPHGHEHVLYDGVDRGRRVVAFGEQHEEGLAKGRPVVFDPNVAAADVTGTLVDDIVLPPTVDAGGCHHPTWSPDGDRFQCSHQQSAFRLASNANVFRRTLHGFTWSAVDNRWEGWDGATAELFPNALSPTDRTAWFDDIRTNLLAVSHRLGDVLPGEVTVFDDAGPRSNLYIWKYGAYCGSRDYVVAQFATTNEDWARAEFGTSDLDPNSDRFETSGHFGQLISRVVLIRLSDGFHWDLTAIVADALGLTESATDHTANIFGIYPTCGPSKPTTPPFAGGSILLDSAYQTIYGAQDQNGN